MTTTLDEPTRTVAEPTAARTSPPHWAVHDLDAALGAVVTDLDARQPLRADQALALKKALRDRHIVLLRGQQLDDAQFLRLARSFGDVFQPPQDVPVLASDPYGGNTPAIVKVSNVENGVLGNHELSAHSDHHWTPVPSSGSLLYALEVPRAGGDTTWINLAAAYNALDAATKLLIDGLQLITYNPFLRRLKPLASGVFPVRSAPAGTHAPRLRPQDPLPRRVHRSRGGRCAAVARRCPGRAAARAPAATPLCLHAPLAGGRHRLLGQPGHAAFTQRVRCCRPARAQAHQPVRQPAILSSASRKHQSTP
jgi:hypothetical protein